MFMGCCCCWMFNTDEEMVVFIMSTKELKRELGKKELLGVALGQVIGAGIMALVGYGIAMTGKSGCSVPGRPTI